MRAPFLMVLLGSPSRGWLGVAPTSSGDLDELQPISLNTDERGSERSAEPSSLRRWK